MTFEQFKEKFEELDFSERLFIYNEYCRNTCNEDDIYEFTEDIVNEFFGSPYDAMRAMHFGEVKSWNDEYFRFNGYGNFVSLCQTEAEEMINDSLREIFDNEDSWRYNIDDDFDEEEDEDPFDEDI